MMPTKEQQQEQLDLLNPWKNLNEKERNELLFALRKQVERKIKHCETWKDSGDKGMCYVYEVNPLRDLFFRLGGQQEHLFYDPYARKKA